MTNSSVRDLILGRNKLIADIRNLEADFIAKTIPYKVGDFVQVDSSLHIAKPRFNGIISGFELLLSVTDVVIYVLVKSTKTNFTQQNQAFSHMNRRVLARDIVGKIEPE